MPGFANTAFIGRQRDLDALSTMLTQGARLITVTGPGGIGKTRLVQRLVTLGRGTEGTLAGTPFVFCDLTDCANASDVCAALGRAMGVALGMSRSRSDAARVLGDVLASRPNTVVVLDNFEQLTDHAAATVGVWLEHAPDTRFVITSRERLRLQGESVLELAPLTLPERGQDPTGSDAVRLLIDCVRRTRGEFDPHGETLTALAEIAGRLDGIPLALELAASRLTAMSPADLLRRLSDRFAVLGHGPRNVQARQATLRGSIDWSWDLLEPWEQDALAQCSIFRGGFRLDDAEHVIDLSRHSKSPPVLDVVQMLREKSLLATHSAPDANALRLGVLLSIREYAEEKLAKTRTADALAKRHANVYVAAAERRAAALDGADALEALAALARERDNLLAVVDRATGARRGDELLALAFRALMALDEIIVTQGPMHAYLERLDALLALEPPAALDPVLRGRAFAQRGDLHRAAGNMDASLADLDRALAIASEQKSVALEGRARRHRTIPLLYRSDADGAWREGQRALEIARSLGDRAEEVLCLWQLSWVAGQRGSTATSRAFLLDALDICRTAGNVRREGRVQSFLAMLLIDEDRLDEAQIAAERALLLHRSFGDVRSESYVEWLFGLIEHARARLAEADVHHARAILLARQVGHRGLEALSLGYRGLVARDAGQFAEAREQLQRSVADLDRLGDRRNAARHGASLAAVEASGDAVEEAERTLGRARALMERSNDPFAHVVALEGAHVTLARARALLRDGNAREAKVARSEVDARLREVETALAPAGPVEEPPRLLLAHSVDARLAVRALKRALRDEAEIVVEDRKSAPPGPARQRPGLRLHAKCEWVDLPNGKRLRFGKRPVARLLLVRLVEERVARPGHGVAAERLLDAGWPGEKILPHAAKNRLYVALTTLRNMGFRDVLKADENGYFLDPEVPIRVVRDDA